MHLCLAGPGVNMQNNSLPLTTIMRWSQLETISTVDITRVLPAAQCSGSFDQLRR